MGQTSLLVHAVNNYIENIDILLAESNLQKEINSLVGTIIKEQLNKILENAELYYLEDESYAKNKKIVFFLEFIQYVCEIILQKYSKEENNYFVFQTTFKDKKVELGNDIKKIEHLLGCLLATEQENINSVEISCVDDEIYIKLNFQKIQEHSLQTK